ncbi:FAD-dependent monooxygenase [Streptomyces albidoflavus]|uniref:FAD-dependent monooxygenase n=1 Tax=Streptomyces albidoflavus TaxID=1886 RepID=UPI0038D0A175
MAWSQDVVFRTSLSGREISRFTGVLGLAPDAGRFAETGQQAPQYVLEELLREAVGELTGARLVEEVAGRPVQARVVSTDPWAARMQIADRMRRGRVFLAGDAALLNPPFGGHGLNTGIGDTVDLGWKLAAVLTGWAGPRVLDSYEAERRPVQERVIREGHHRHHAGPLHRAARRQPGGGRRGGRGCAPGRRPRPGDRAGRVPLPRPRPRPAGRGLPHPAAGPRARTGRRPAASTAPPRPSSPPPSPRPAGAPSL